MLEKALLYVLEILILKLASSLKWKLFLFFKMNESMYSVHLGKMVLLKVAVLVGFISFPLNTFLTVSLEQRSPTLNIAFFSAEIMVLMVLVRSSKFGMKVLSSNSFWVLEMLNFLDLTKLIIFCMIQSISYLSFLTASFSQLVHGIAIFVVLSFFILSCYLIIVG